MAKQKQKITKRRTTRPEAKPVVSTQMIMIVAAIAIILTGGLMLLGNWGSISGQPTTAATTGIDTENLPFLGSEDAPVTMIDFSDYGCGHCQAFEREKLPVLKEQYIDTGLVKFVSHPYYLGNPRIAPATEANWCAAEQDLYFEYRHEIFANPAAMQSQAGLLDLANNVDGLDTEALAACISSGRYGDVAEQGRLVGTRRGVSSTPTFFINGQKVEGNQPIETFQQVIEQAIAQANL